MAEQDVEAKLVEFRAKLKNLQAECGQASKMVHSTSITIDRYGRMLEQAKEREAEFKETLLTLRARIAIINSRITAAEEAQIVRKLQS